MARAMKVVFQLVVVLCVVNMIAAHLVIPFKFEGFVYNNRMIPNSVTVEAFVDPMCEDSCASWSPLKKIVDDNKDSVTLIVHPFPLPYRENAFIVSRALHATNWLYKDYPFKLLDHIYQKANQTKFREMTTGPPLNVTQAVKTFVFQALEPENITMKDFEAKFNHDGTDWDTRTSFMYACSRAVTRTPYVFINGVPWINMNDTIDATNLRKTIESLLHKGT